MNEIELVQTCGACPEQYDAMYKGVQVGYLRLRHGYFTVQMDGPDGKLVYDANPIGDGCFDPDERDFHLACAKLAIVRELITARIASHEEGTRAALEYVIEQHKAALDGLRSHGD